MERAEPDFLTFNFDSEIRYCSLLIGIIEFAWSFIGLSPYSESLFARVMEQAGVSSMWFILMSLIGMLLIAGSVLPWRSGRHIGLFLSSLVWFTMFGVFISYVAITPVTITMPVFGVFSVLLMYTDAKRKRRHETECLKR